MSEVESLSDSDWLDIASNRESDDNESVGSRDSEVDRLSPSRRSSISLGSSRDGEVEAWEGFAEEEPDNSAPYNSPLTAVPVSPGSGTVFKSLRNLTIHEDANEEQRVKEGLDQSMISTLSSSRSSVHPTTAHNSVRDLRLSFPDPLTSSRDELSKSYEEVALTESIPAPSSVEDGVLSAPTTPGSEDTNSLDEPAVQEIEVREKSFSLQSPPSPTSRCELDIYLYGATSPIKWSFVETLVEKMMAGAGGSLHFVCNSEDGCVCWIETPRTDNIAQYITVHDRTSDSNPTSELERVGISAFPFLNLTSSVVVDSHLRSTFSGNRVSSFFH